MSEITLKLTAQEAAAALLMVALGTDAYEGKEPEPMLVENLDRLPGIHLRSLNRKLALVADTLERDADGL